MRGMFGGFHTALPVRERLEAEFRRLDPRFMVNRAGEALWGSCPSEASGSLRSNSCESTLIWDGVMGVSQWFQARRNRVLEAVTREAASIDGPVANTAFRDLEGGWVVASDWSGAFPLYYWTGPTGFLFSSHVRPLARALAAQPDLPGIVQYLRRGYTINGRTLFDRIRRFVPGEQITHRPPDLITRSTATSRFWTDSGDAGRTGLDEQIWQLLTAELRTLQNTEGRIGVMVSGGWDSRTLLAGAVEAIGRDRIVCYSHGDPASREVRLAGEIARRTNTQFHNEPLADGSFAVEQLERWFGLVETVVFPPWHHAGEVLGQLGASSVIAGVFGEVLGGRYGSAVMLEGRHKIAAVGRILLGLEHHKPLTDHRAAILSLFVPSTISKPWCLSHGAWPGEDAAIAASRNDVAAALHRLENRGVSWAATGVEAFVTEHRGAQYGAAQLLSCRHSLDIGMPFANRRLTMLATGAPMEARIHNTLNRRLLAQTAPQLLSLPLAATLVPARSPIVVQEASRWVRRTLEYGQWRLHFRSHGRVPVPRYSWANFEFLRGGGTLNAVAEDLRSEMWDHGEIRRRLSRVGSSPTPMHAAADMLMKVYTVDLMLRN